MKRLLIANRGEIAVRIAKACRELGIETVAVYSDADAASPHLDAADQAVHLGSSSPQESYLNLERIMSAAAATQCDALHPGYGFLSENSALAERCEAAGVSFVGPPADAMRKLGDKSSAKELATRAEVPTVPTYDPQKVPEDAYPVLVKASAGGGGRGMRIVGSASELQDALTAAGSEARAGFGDDRLLIEKLVSGARHVEVQLLADAHGNCVAMGDRDCTLQRRHQKVVEEAPAPELSVDLHSQLGQSAVALAQAAGYVNAGTAEFLVAPDGSFYFLELNARLQVEHPVTEMAFGIDLVQWQLRIARGEQLDLAAGQLSSHSHAIEARLYAEDPVSFLPTGGRVLALELPNVTGVRIDHALREGLEISLDYDPLLAKIIASGSSREEARERLLRALRQTVILGVTTNQPLLQHALSLGEFVQVQHATTTLEQRPLDGDSLRPSEELAGAARRTLRASPNRETDDPFVQLAGYRGPGSFSSAGAQSSSDQIQAVAAAGDRIWFSVDGVGYEVSRDHIEPEVVAAASADGTHAALTAPMPGTIIRLVAEGTLVRAGEPVVVLEAMKMENAIGAPFDGTVTSISHREGDRVTKGAVLAEVVR